ncbi:ABC transporter substrate-binding protein [Criibacterium bergeronii]|uniref:ABC transporter substrate-binding protein n=1 Tax=Criibacterium bergeronii TaxID=1871336 RepID=A0A371IJL7_9FIRM|nr:ABC transporter substrate-binding protein [Criibacterium bergeronii]MBS6064187.1 ABC transporter substrate-binding protein [Peptostreptococcaceae bacterium]RDY20671.1 ABC transporter substrate-binding protein [Criibacterium bergeronii]
MKKSLIALLLSSVALLSACSASGETKQDAAKAEEIQKIKIGITQIMEHPALDKARESFIEKLKTDGIDAEIIYKNSQGDFSVANTIAQSFMDEKVDLIYAISTPSAQAAKQVTSDVPIVFSAVTDPVQSELEAENITGASDKAPIKTQLELFNKLDKNIKKIGIVYSTSESNSQIQVKQAKEIANELGLEIVDVGVNNINDLPQGIDAMLGKSDAVYMITDNLVANSLQLLTSKTNKAKKILIASYVIDNPESAKSVLLSSGVSYTQFGEKAAEMAEKILKDKVSPSSIPVYYTDESVSYVSMDVAKELGLDENNEVIKNAEKIQ